MIIIKNRFIPFGSYKAVTIFPFIFTKADLKNVEINHESIHMKQQLEMLIVFFYIWYVIEYICKLIYFRNMHKAYRNISFEVEAYKFQEIPEQRKRYGWLKYLN